MDLLSAATYTDADANTYACTASGDAYAYSDA
jgi:hypothetical protein